MSKPGRELGKITLTADQIKDIIGQEVYLRVLAMQDKGELQGVDSIWVMQSYEGLDSIQDVTVTLNEELTDE